MDGWWGLGDCPVMWLESRRDLCEETYNKTENKENSGRKGKIETMIYGWFGVRHLWSSLSKSLIGLYCALIFLMIFTVQMTHIYKRIEVGGDNIIMIWLQLYLITINANKQIPIYDKEFLSLSYILTLCVRSDCLLLVGCLYATGVFVPGVLWLSTLLL